MNLSAALLQMRKSTDYNQGELAKVLGVTQTYISLIEAGKKVPSMGLVQDYCKAINKPVAIVLWMAIEETDVQDNKKEAFKQLKPLIDNLIGQIF